MAMNALIVRLLKKAGLLPADTIVVGPARGLRCDPGPSNPAYAYGDNELPVQESLVTHLSTGEVFYDVGANIGFLTVLAAQRVGPTGTVYAFEPVPTNAAYVRNNALVNRFSHVRVFEQAVSNRVGKGQLSLAAYSGGSALSSAGAPEDLVGTCVVELVTIDELVAHNGLKPPTFVKIDVEGAELEVLEGMTAVARQYCPVILLEVDAGDQEALQRKQSACEDWLTRHGYRCETLPNSYAGGTWLVTHILAVQDRPAESRRR
jgi:FkbM family methyltransferase